MAESSFSFGSLLFIYNIPIFGVGIPKMNRFDIKTPLSDAVYYYQGA